MQFLVAFMLGTVLIGGSRAGRVFRRRPSYLLVLSAFVAVGFYSLRVVL